MLICVERIEAILQKKCHNYKFDDKAHKIQVYKRNRQNEFCTNILYILRVYEFFLETHRDICHARLWTAEKRQAVHFEF